jgi:hypothetical protein
VHKKTLDEIGSIYGVSRERIRQIENRAISKLKKLCKNKNYVFNLILPPTAKNMESGLPPQNPRIYDSQNLEN